MKRLALSLIAFIALSASAAAQQSTVAAVRGKYPTPLGVRHGEFLIEVACATGKGLLRKDWGTFVRLADGTGVAQDIVMERDGRHYDILGDGENRAIPNWDLVADPPTVDPARYYAPACGAPPPVTTPTPSEPVPSSGPALDLKELTELARLILEGLAGQEAKLQAIAEKLQAIEARPFPPFPSYVGRVPVLGTFTLEPRK